MKLEIDPLGKFPASPNSILEATGILPHWLSEGVEQGESAKDALLNRYDFYFGPMEGGEIDKDGNYCCPDDPKLHPLVKVDLPTETVYFYQYSMVGVVNKESGEIWVAGFDL